MKRKMISLFLVAVLIISTITLAHASRPYIVHEQEGLFLEEQPIIDAEMDSRRDEWFAANYRNATNQLEAFYEGIARSRDGEFIYPEHFGGVYIDNDGNAVLLIVESRFSRAEADNNTMNLMNEGILYRFVEFSYAELIETKETIFSTMMARRYTIEACIYASNISMISIAPSCNQVIVGIVDYNNDMINGFKQYISDSSMIVFVQNDIIIPGGGYSIAHFVTMISVLMGIVVLVIILVKIGRRLQ